jgi:hypothetical protein
MHSPPRRQIACYQTIAEIIGAIGISISHNAVKKLLDAA